MGADLNLGQFSTVRTTPYGGRGVYAQTYIKAGTCVQRCPAPYAYVIARKFRKEVCAWCFKYAFEHGKNTWRWKYEAAECDSSAPHVHEQEPRKKSTKRKGKTAGENVAGISFCSAECRSTWCCDIDVGGLHAALNATVEKLVVPHKDRKTADPSPPAVPQSGEDEADDLTLLQTLQRHWTHTSDVLLSSVSSDTPIMATRQTLSHQEQLGMIWKQAELLYIPSKQHSRHFQPCREEHLTEFEVDTGRFVISALVRYFSEEIPAAGGSTTQQITSDRDLPCGGGGPGKPAVTAAHLRVYGFVRRVIEMTLQAVAARPRDWNRLRTYVDKSDFVRGLLGRDHGNVFGIWDCADQDDSEMLGWGMYVQGSYFNHDCSPNVKKQRVGRAMNFYAIRDIMPGEEMRIAYINVADPVINRRAELKEEWYFDCICARCQAEHHLGSITSVDVVVDSGYISQVDD
ncbi:hypothetical protein APHAL10511_000496 [Amanita phalloides]|nr:hypothetical protein APHAL10511_000496 [Amanita phalloides]